MALRELDLVPAREFGSEILTEALRVTSRRFPRMTQLGDNKQIQGPQVERIMAKWPDNSLILIVAGTPCQDNSTLRGRGRE